MRDAASRDKMTEKLDTAQKALSIVDAALKSYPDEITLRDSQEVIQNFLSSIKVSNWIEKAERAYFKGNHKRAISLYQDALFDLKRDNFLSRERELMGEKILLEIKRIKEIVEKS